MDLSLSTPDGRAHCLALLAGTEFEQLEAYRHEITARHGATPHVDPLDGGVTARILLLLETPGPTGSTPRFVSRDNPTGTARNLTRFLAAAGIERRHTLLWNTVPWIIHAEGARNRAPRPAEIAAGLALLPGLLDLLPNLRAIVLAGRVAQCADAMLRETRPTLIRIPMPHPSPIYINTSPAIRLRIAAALAEAAAVHHRETS